MKKKGVKMPQKRSEMHLERVIKANQVDGSQNKHQEAYRVAMLRPLGNRACCCSIGK
jgi:uncharacterized protein involved in high-affinity Fe2+ transport